MQKYLFAISLLFSSIISFAQDDKSPAYKTGYAIGRVVGFVLIAALLIWGIRKLFKK